MKAREQNNQNVISQIIEVEYLSKKDIVVSTDRPTTTLTEFEPIFYITDNGVEIADGCHCEECAMLNFALLCERRNGNE